MNAVVIQETTVSATNVRERILSFEGLLRQSLDHGYTDADCPLTHHFAPGAYGREIFIPQGAIVVGKIHKHAHLNILSQGSVSVLTEDGPSEFSAPRTWVSSPGTKRVVFAHTDVVWTTIHITEETDLEKIEDFVIAKTYDALDLFLQLSGRALT